MNRFDVLIVDSRTSEVVSVAGKALSAADADRRELTALSRTNIGDYFVTQAEAGRFDKGSTFKSGA